MEIPVLGPSESQMSDLSLSMSIDLILREEIHLFIKGQMNQNFDIWSLVSLKQLNTKTDHYKVYSPNNFAS